MKIKVLIPAFAGVLLLQDSRGKKSKIRRNILLPTDFSIEFQIRQEQIL